MDTPNQKQVGPAKRRQGWRRVSHPPQDEYNPTKTRNSDNYWQWGLPKDGRGGGGYP